MRGRRGAVADPDTGERRGTAKRLEWKGQIVFRTKAGEIGVEVGRADIQGLCMGIVAGGEHPVEKGVELHARGGEVHRGHVGIVEEPAANLGRAAIPDYRGAGVEGFQIRHRRFGPLKALGDQRPIPHQAAQDDRLLLRDQARRIEQRLRRGGAHAGTGAAVWGSPNSARRLRFLSSINRATLPSDEAI